MAGGVRGPGGATMRLVTIQQLSPRSTTAVDHVGLDGHRRETSGGGPATAAAGCPFNVPVNAADEQLGSVRPMQELDGPVGWPIVGNFLTYLKKENQGKMHEVQVSRNSITEL